MYEWLWAHCLNFVRAGQNFSRSQFIFRIYKKLLHKLCLDNSDIFACVLKPLIDMCMYQVIGVSGRPWGDPFSFHSGLVGACSPPLTALQFINSCQLCHLVYTWVHRPCPLEDQCRNLTGLTWKNPLIINDKPLVISIYWTDKLFDKHLDQSSSRWATKRCSPKVKNDIKSFT